MSLSLEEKRKVSLKTEWESYCDNRNGCGTACCFYEGSPCENLQWIKKKEGIGVCSIYERRFGVRKTVDGKEFLCAPMFVRLKEEGIPHPKCGYASVRSIQGEAVPMRTFTV